MQFTTFTNSAVILLSFVALIGASPAIVETRAAQDVYAPNITYPDAQTVWPAKSSQKVTWDVSSPPQQITNPVGQIKLVSGGLITPVILGDKFNILLGSIQVDVPWVDPGKYSLVLFGDSGNVSPLFSITAA